MDEATRAAFRAVLSGLAYAGRIDSNAAAAIVQGLDDAGTKALTPAARDELHILSAELAAEFGIKD